MYVVYIKCTNVKKKKERVIVSIVSKKVLKKTWRATMEGFHFPRDIFQIGEICSWTGHWHLINSYYTDETMVNLERLVGIKRMHWSCVDVPCSLWNALILWTICGETFSLVLTGIRKELLLRRGLDINSFADWSPQSVNIRVFRWVLMEKRLFIKKRTLQWQM